MHTHSISLSHRLSHSLTHTHTQTRTRTHTHTHTNTNTHTHTLLHTHTHCISWTVINAHSWIWPSCSWEHILWITKVTTGPSWMLYERPSIPSMPGETTWPCWMLLELGITVQLVKLVMVRDTWYEALDLVELDYGRIRSLETMQELEKATEIVTFPPVYLHFLTHVTSSNFYCQRLKTHNCYSTKFGYHAPTHVTSPNFVPNLWLRI